MTADWWARGIAMGAAGAAVLNMGIAYRTYRRVRPKIGIKIEGTGVDRSSGDFVFNIRLTNAGATAIEVEEVRIIVAHNIL